MGSSATPACPQPALTIARAACGTSISLKQITDRRGSAVWKATGPDGSVAIKVGYDQGADQHVLREAAVIDLMGLDYRLGSGTTKEGSWLVTSWLTGSSTWSHFDGVHESTGGDRRERALRAAIELCRAVAALHARGWVHADLQPSHAIHTYDGVRLIDVSWAHHPGHPPAPGFRGGIVHLIAPELAATIASALRKRSRSPAIPTQQSDVYALAGTLWTCATSEWPLDYAAAKITPREEGADAVRDAIAAGDIPLAEPVSWPEFHELLGTVLAARPQDRPSAAELASLLRKLMP